MMMRVLLTGGGTGGHVNPALAIAHTIKINCPDAEIAFVGTEQGKECDLVPREGYPLYFVEVQGIRRSLSPANIRALYLAVTSPYSKKTTEILERFQPDIVIGTGGYACWPLLKAAARAGIPTMVHESNCQPGLAVRRLQSCVDTILLNFPESLPYIKRKEKCVVVGNPLRGGFGEVSTQQAREHLGIRPGEKRVLCYAGSRGSSTVNAAVLEMLSALAPEYSDVCFVLSSGTRNFEEAERIYRRYQLEKYPNVTVEPYIYDMPMQMAAADVVISRAGAISLSELAQMGKASIIVPSPYVADNHQLRNARALSDRGAALLVEEKNFADGALLRATRTLLEDEELCATLRHNIRSFASQDANRLIYERIVRAVEEYRARKK